MDPQAQSFDEWQAFVANDRQLQIELSLPAPPSMEDNLPIDVRTEINVRMFKSSKTAWTGRERSAIIAQVLHDLRRPQQAAAREIAAPHMPSFMGRALRRTVCSPRR